MKLKIEKELKSLIEHFVNQHDIPGLAYGIMTNNHTWLTGGFGKTSLSSDSREVDSDTIFSIQSITKSFTASTLVHLANHEHQFDLDTPIIEYLPSFRTLSGKYEKITTNHLLSHTAGFPNDLWMVTLLDRDLINFAKDLPDYQYLFEKYPNLTETLSTLCSREAVTKWFANVDLMYSPGESWCYCTDAYVIAAHILEIVSNCTWEEYLQQHILDPLQLTSTYVNPTHLQNNYAHYYMSIDGEKLKIPQPKNIVGAPSGFIYSTIADLMSYMKEHMGTTENKMMSPALIQQMQKPLAIRDEKHLSYGLGWKIRKKGEMTIIEHAGGYPGVSAHLSMIPKEQTGIVFLSNTDHVPLQHLIDRIIDVIH